MAPSVRPRGFTAVELLVAVAMVVVLVGLLLPAVQKTRESASVAKCQNNLRQLALALHGYHNTNRTFPAGAVGPNPTGAFVHQHTWVEVVLPYLEQHAVFSRLDLTVYNQQGPNPGVLNDLVIPNLLCPSDPDAGLMDNRRLDYTWDYGFSYLPGTAGTFSMGQSYAPCGGPLKMNVCPYGALSPNTNCKATNGGSVADPYGGIPGLFGGGPWKFELKQCRDGASNTFLIGDALPVYGQHMMYFSAHMNAASTNPPPNYFKINPKQCPKAKATRWIDLPANTYCYAEMGGFNSLHPGGLNMAFADGSVRFINEAINYQTWNLLGDKADGRVIGAY